jgi:uncharacterized protein involved in response to NO
MKMNLSLESLKSQLNNTKKSPNPFLSLGFRPFFLLATSFAAISIILWSLIYFSSISLPFNAITPYQWHAHDMIYGFALSVIAGFLLTGVQNWTGLQSLSGKPLLILALCWLTARILIISDIILWAGFFDLTFIIVLNITVARLIIKAKQWKQLAIVFKLFTLFIGNSLFYLGALNIIENGTYLGIYGGMYLIIGLIMMMGRRVIPFFIEKGVDKPVKIYNSKLIDFSSLGLFIIFFISELSQQFQPLSGYTALLLFITNAIRLSGWYTKLIWKKPLLWSLYLAMCFISLGFLLHFLHEIAYSIWQISKFISIHSFAYGGIGMITFGMMARVALGHTGRSIHQPPKGITTALIILTTGAIFRILFCLIFPSYYTIWILLAQICWIIAFLIFVYLYYSILTQEDE